jgi:hypothetical protein
MTEHTSSVTPLLSWRVPTAGDPRLLRLGLAQVGLASIVAGLMLVVAAPRPWLGPALLGLVPLAVYMAYRRWHAYQRSMDGDDNVRIDEAGIHWLDGGGQQQTFSRVDIVDFAIGRDSDTLRPVPALSLHLRGGFESQPIELHPPAVPDAVRHVLSQRWGLPEVDQSAEGDENGYDAAIAVYSECHEEFQEWHWEGSRAELERCFVQFAAAAKELPLPPPGARPLARILQLTLRDPTRLRISHAARARFEPHQIAAPAATLEAIAEQASAVLRGEEAERRFDVELTSQGKWTFHLHVAAE